MVQSVNWRRVLRVASWNAMFLVCGLGLVAVAIESWLRLTWPFAHSAQAYAFVVGVGRFLAPHTEVRWTDHNEFWTVLRANSLGFLDREPPSPELARTACHVAFVGDSLVESRAVTVADKLQVRLEEMAADRLPDLDVVTTAWGVRGMGQIQQLPMWDKWIRHSSPDVVALVWVHNDYEDNMRTDWYGWGATAHRNSGNRIVLRLPGAREGREVPWTGLPAKQPSFLATLLQTEVRRYRYLRMQADRAEASPAPQIEFTAFALDQWQERAARAGSRIVVLSTHVMRMPLSWMTEAPFEHLVPLAKSKGIPLVDQYDYIVRQGGDPRDANWQRDRHWNPAGARWAAEAMLEYLASNPEVCDA